MKSVMDGRRRAIRRRRVARPRTDTLIRTRYSPCYWPTTTTQDCSCSIDNIRSRDLLRTQAPDWLKWHSRTLAPSWLQNKWRNWPLAPDWLERYWQSWTLALGWLQKNGHHWSPARGWLKMDWQNWMLSYDWPRKMLHKWSLASDWIYKGTKAPDRLQKIRTKKDLTPYWLPWHIRTVLDWLLCVALMGRSLAQVTGCTIFPPLCNFIDYFGSSRQDEKEPVPAPPLLLMALLDTLPKTPTESSCDSCAATAALSAAAPPAGRPPPSPTHHNAVRRWFKADIRVAKQPCLQTIKYL